MYAEYHGFAVRKDFKECWFLFTRVVFLKKIEVERSCWFLFTRVVFLKKIEVERFVDFFYKSSIF
jgi:hypothetical protein